MALEDIFKALEEQAVAECECRYSRRHASHADVDRGGRRGRRRSRSAKHMRRKIERVRARAWETVNAARLDARKRVVSVRGRLEGSSKRSPSRSRWFGKLGVPELFRLCGRGAVRSQGPVVIRVDPADAELARQSACGCWH